MSSSTPTETAVVAVPAFSDNYLWLIVRDGHAAVVDPGDAAPIEAALAQHRVKLDAIVLTHHHRDHTGGVAALVAAHGPDLPVFGPATEDIAGVTVPLTDGDRIVVPGIALPLEVLDVPGHTHGHIAYFGAIEGQPVLFCGDTLFAGGCGRLLGGTARELYHSLSRLATLPGPTRVYCAHEYTQSNLRFAHAVEPDNAALSARIAEVNQRRARGEATVPSTLALELATNPFLRTAVPAVMHAVHTQGRTDADSGLDTFTALRAWKDNFK